MTTPTNVAVLGLGYVGSVSAACLADIGHNVVGADRDDHKVQAILAGRAPFYEPGLEPLVRKNVEAGRLTATTSTADALRNADVALVCVGTPSEKNGNLGLEQLRRVAGDIAACSTQLSKPLTVAIRSTVFPGTCEEVVQPIFRDFPGISIVSNPEFLREGAAVKDFIEPSLIVVGGIDPAAVQRVASIYDGLGVRPCLVSLRTAEMIKYACNAFHAVKVSFANEIGALASRLDVDAHEVMATLCEDVKLNTSAAYLKPGFAYGGSCLPKDLRALVYRASRLDLKLPLLESALPSNREHLQRGIEAVLDLPGRIGVVGLAFKEDTDDLRESPVVALLEQLIGKGRDVRVFDPHIQLDAIYGTNRSFVINSIPHIGRLMDRTLDDLLGWAEHIVLAQKQTAAAMDKIEASGLPVLDLVRCSAGTRPSHVDTAS
ncbi:MAG TPA: nucleotide sugar dehydrogenase [Bryobacteraceae bacterium]|nr:nucleotide sugar dehydrogenase [Bryobacteraceae bacterium]